METDQDVQLREYDIRVFHSQFTVTVKIYRNDLSGQELEPITWQLCSALLRHI